MTISMSMNFEIATLIDITQTGQTKFRSEDRTAINQQANWNTFLQVIGLRANPYFDAKPKCVEDVDITNGEFGSEYSGKQRLWYFKFSIEQEDALNVDFLKDDFDLVPIIKNLNESIVINTSAFRTKDKQSTNIVFNRVDNTTE